MKNQTVLVNALKQLIKRLESTEKFVLKHAPDVCKQMVTEALIWPIGTLFVLVPIFLLGLYFPFHSFYIPWDGSHEGWCVLHVIASIVDLILLVPICEGVQRILYVKYCPKLFLLREIKRLLR